MDPNNEKKNDNPATDEPAVDAPDAGGADDAADTQANPDTAALAAFDKGVQEAKDEQKTPAEPAQSAADETPDDGGDKPDGAEGEDGGAETGKPEKAEKQEADPDKDAKVEDEIKELGLKERAAERFRELTSRVAETEPLRQRAARADEWEQTVLSTGANPEQFGSALTYLRDINSGDPAKMRNAYDQLSEELKTLGGLLGMPAPGVDPLEEHQDLKEAVEAGDMGRKHAEELVASRQSQRLTQAATQQRTSATQQEAAIQAGTQKVAALGVELRAADPASFETKYKLIAPMVNRIQKTLPPDQWAEAIKEQWDVLPATPAPARRPTPSSQPLRPTGASAGQLRKPQNDVESFEFGVAQARASGL